MKMKYSKMETGKDLLQKKCETLKRKLRPSAVKTNNKNINAEDFIEL